VTIDLTQRFRLDDTSIAKHSFMTATVLDPQLKRLVDVPQDVRSAAYDHVKQLTGVAEQQLQSPTLCADDEDKDVALPAKKAKVDSSRAAAPEFLLSDNDNDALQHDAPNDFDAYLASATPGGRSEVDVLQWWNKHQKSYPATASVARRFCTIPATSVQSELLFSATGHDIWKLHSRLLPEHAEMLVFFNKNNGLFE